MVEVFRKIRPYPQEAHQGKVVIQVVGIQYFFGMQEHLDPLVLAHIDIHILKYPTGILRLQVLQQKGKGLFILPDDGIVVVELFPDHSGGEHIGNGDPGIIFLNIDRIYIDYSAVV